MNVTGASQKWAARSELSQSHHNRLDDYELTLISLCVCCIRYVGCIYSLMEKI